MRRFGPEKIRRNDVKFMRLNGEGGGEIRVLFGFQFVYCYFLYEFIYRKLSALFSWGIENFVLYIFKGASMDLTGSVRAMNAGVCDEFRIFPLR